MNPTISKVNSGNVISFKLPMSVVDILNPVYIGMAPIIVNPDALLRISGSEFKNEDGKGAIPTVRAKGVTVVAAVNPGTLRSPTDQKDPFNPDHAYIPTKESCYAYVPSLYELQSTNFKLLDIDMFHFQYQRNCFILPFVITVYNNDDGTSSNPIILGVRLPAPTAGAPRQTDRQITVGLVPECHAWAEDTEDLGMLAPPKSTAIGGYGEVRWYSAESVLPTLDVGLFLPALINDGQTLWDLFVKFVLNFATCSLTAIFDNLATTRKQGALLLHAPLEEGTYWHDDGVAFNLPPAPPPPDLMFGGDAGIAVIWRDDIPSRPLPICNLTFDCDNADAINAIIKDEVKKLWSFAMPPSSHKGPDGSINVTSPLEPDGWLPVAGKTVECPPFTECYWSTAIAERE